MARRKQPAPSVVALFQQMRDSGLLAFPTVSTRMKTLSVIALLLAAALLLFYLAFVNHVSANRVGLAYDSMSGEVTLQQPGFHITPPTTLATTVTTLPFRVIIPTDARVVNMRLVRFKPEGYREYIATQGWEYLANESEFQNIMLGYAFSDRTWPFMEVSKPDASSIESAGR